MKNNKVKGLISSTLMLAIFATSTISSQEIYGSTADLQRRQQQIESETAEVQQSINVVNRQMTETQRQIQEIESELRDVASQLDTITTELDRTRDILDETVILLAEAEDTREEQQERFVQRARFMHMSSRTSYIDLILNAESFSDLLRRIDYVNRIVEHDQELVRQFIETEELISEKLETTYIQERNLQALEAQEVSRRNEYEGIRRQRVALLNSLEAEERDLLQQMWELEESSREVERLIRAAIEAQRVAEAAAAEERRRQQQRQQAPSRVIVDTSNASSSMAWPVPGRSTISSGYGNRRSPISGGTEFHTGIDIPAPNGTNVIAADRGTVIFSGWMGGYGNTVIIDHGGSISTLYAHHSRNLVSVGQVVERGQVIAEVGSTGFSTGPHLHFEVRRNGRHIDPMPFLR